jgi:hypothetical protein
MLSGEQATSANLQAALREIAAQASAEDNFVFILIGHGSYDGAEYKFNLTGPDITATDLAVSLQGVRCRRQLVVNTTSASGAAMGALKKKGRTVIAATKSGTEKNAPVFARFWVEALRDPAADLDKNESVSALEAWRFTEQRVARYYETNKRIATEHSLFDDKGIGEGVRAISGDQGQEAARFILLRGGQSANAMRTPGRMQLVHQREELEGKIDELKQRKDTLEPAQYQQQLRALLLQLARLQAEIDK